MPGDELLTPKEAAAVLGVHPTTLYRWSQMGAVDYVLTPGRHRRYRRSVIDIVLSTDSREQPARPEPTPPPTPPVRLVYERPSIHKP